MELKLWVILSELFLSRAQRTHCPKTILYVGNQTSQLHTAKCQCILCGRLSRLSLSIINLASLRAMANDPELNIGNNIGMRETQFFHMFLQKKHCEITLNVFSCVFVWKIKQDHAKCLSDKY